MNREYIVECLTRIRETIAVGQASDERKRLDGNYRTSLRLCDEMITSASDLTFGLSKDTLLGKFDRHVCDCLPWSQPMLDVIAEETNKIERELKQI